MESSESSVSSVANEASQLLKDILNVGKPPRSSGSDISIQSGAVSLESHSDVPSGDAPDKNGNAVLVEFLRTMNQQQQNYTTQKIVLQGDDLNNSHSVYGQEVDIITSSASSPAHCSPGSNKVKINPVVNYDWEHKYYIGNLVAVHRSGSHLAYVLKGQSGGIVRVINRKTAERALLKGFTGKVKDISFAHIPAVVLGAVDEIGNMFIYEIFEGENGKIDTSLVLQVNRPEKTGASDNHRLIWCPYIPDEEDSSGTTANTTSDSALPDDVGKLLVLTHEEVAEMWNVDTVVKEYGKGPHLPEDVDLGYLTIEDHQKPIVDASFSPDGTALATASLDGEVKFFQVYLQDKSPPRCLHQWQPHDGKPISSLFFLDDHKRPNPEVQFWKFAVTGTNHNREIKIWSCETWTCLQTIHFQPPPGYTTEINPEPCLKAGMDFSATYLTLSDINRKVLYILQLYQHPDETHAHVSSISEFLLTQPCLSFAVLDARRTRLKRLPEDNNLGDVTTGEIDGDDEEEVPTEIISPEVGTVVKLYSVHTKALQELQIRYRPESSMPPPSASISTLSQDGLRDGLSDMSIDGHAYDGENLATQRSHESDATHVSDRTHVSERTRHSENSHHGGDLSYQSEQSLSSDRSREGSEPKPLLLTPEAFTSPRKVETIAQQESVRSSGSSFTQVTAMDDHSVVPSHPSPVSSVTLTPSSSHDMTLKETPTSVPVPPITADEEAGLLTPTSTAGSGREFTATPPSTTRSQGPFPSAPSLTSSPAAAKPDGSTSPHHMVADQSTIQSSSETLNDFYSLGVGASGRRGLLRSTGSSSSTSLELETINAGDDDIISPETSLEAPPVEKETVAEDAESGYNAWPRPPDVSEVNRDTQHLATQAIERAAYRHRLNEVENVEEDEDDDVHIEEVKDVVLEDEADEEEEEEEACLDSSRSEAKHTELPCNETSTDSDLCPVQPGLPMQHASPKLQSTEPLSHTPDGTSNAICSQPMPVTMPPPGPVELASADRQRIEQMQSSLKDMLTILQAQQQEIVQLRTALDQQRQTNDSVEALQGQLDQLEGALSSKVTGALTQHQHQQSQHLQQALSSRETQDQRRQDRLVSNLSQTLERTITQRLDKVVKDEVRRTVTPGIASVLEPLKEQIHLELAQKLTATDSLLKESIGKMCRSRQTVEIIGQAAANSIQGPIQAACRDVVMPAFDRSCQNIFHQINETFQRGTQEYVHQLDSHLEQVRRRHDEMRDPVVGQLRSMVDAVKNTSEAQKPMAAQLQATCQGLQTAADAAQASYADTEPVVQRALSSFHDDLMTSIRKVVQEEVNLALRDQQEAINNSVLGALQSRAVTPVPTTPDPQISQATILHLLRQGQLNTAFQQALSASDLNLVLFVCESVKPAQLFNQQPCPLQQPVLLSLIQQLSIDLNSHSELKHKYLEEAVMNLDTSNPVTREHMATVLGGLCQRLMSHLQAHPADRNARSMRMLLMATQSLLK